MISLKKSFFAAAAIAAGVSLIIPALAFAATPTLSVSSTGNADNVQINVTGDPNVSVLLFAANQSIALGSTNSNGQFSTTISSGTYSIAANAPVYVRTNGINGPESSTVNWPYFQSATSSTISLSQNALLMNPGQTTSVTASVNYLYLSSNTNPAIANINLNANQITVTANTYGTTTATICANGNTANCATLAITVQNSNSQQLSFSPNNFSLVFGQSSQISISGGSGSYMVSNNSNSGAVQANVSGSVVTVSAVNSTAGGAAAITVCTTDSSDCGIINVNATTATSTSVTFSQTNPVVPFGQNTTVTIYGGILGNNFYVASNSNPSIIQANITGNILTLIANTNSGSTTLSVCAFGGSCGTVTANAGSNASSNGAISLSQTSLSILAGQSSNITISGGSTPYSVSTTGNSLNIFNTAINGNTLTVYGVNPGSSTVNICASVGCATLSITISSVTSSGNPPPSFSQNNMLLNIGQQVTVYISGGANFYVANNSNSAVASASVSGNAAVVTANAAGTDNLQICQSDGQCAALYVTVNAPTATTTPTATAPTVTSNGYILPRYLGYGDSGTDVLHLQKILVALKLLSATPNGNYGPATVAAVKKFQKIYGISQTGNVGPATKTALDGLKFPVAAL